MNNLGVAELNWDAQELDTGLGIGLLRMPVKASYQYILGEHSDGVFLVVINGSIDADGQTLGVHKNVYVPAKHESFAITTTNSYAEILVLQMPQKNASY
jgi:redox-sensitive bicupin YhaK (pirin superfamily)